MYTVMISDDGMFSAEYVMPPALSIPLGTSGSAIEVMRNEDGTFSANGEVITAETMVTAENGNVYAAVLSPEGVPVSVMHVAAMQDVMLGELGGTVKLTQAEDMSWRLGETPVADGYVHTHANGNMYALMMDAEGMWSAMYQKVEVMVSLGTQGSVTLERAEDMSWWLGSEAVDVASEVMSDSGNTYTLWYTDGVWSAQFEPESMMIEGTGLVATTKEDRSGYNVDGEDLPATGTGDLATSMGTYRVTMMDGALMGVRLDPVAIDNATRFRTHGLTAFPTILGDEDDTEDVNEGMTALRIAGENHPFSALLGSGMSEKQGDNYVAKAREELVEIRARIESVLDVFEKESDKETQVRLLWGTVKTDPDPDINETARRTNVRDTLENVFGRIAGFSENTAEEGEDPDWMPKEYTPDIEDALSEIDGLIMALSSVDSLAAALEDDGVLGELDVDDKGKTAEFIFDATKSESSVSYGMTGMTRYGAIYKRTRSSAVSNPGYKFTPNDDFVDETNESLGKKDWLGADSENSKGSDADFDELGAFAFGVTDETVRAARVASVGNAFYEGGTLAVDRDGTHYSGDISIRVKFSTEDVDGLITNLRSADGEPWQHLFADVSSISLPTAGLNRTAQFNSAANPNSGIATISYALRAGSRGTEQEMRSSWSGRLLTGEEEGDHVVGQWYVGLNPDGFSYLAGGFGAERVADEPDNRPALDDGTEAKAKLLTTFDPDNDVNPVYALATSTANPPTTGHGSFADNGTTVFAKGKTALGDGNLTITVGKFGWTQTTPASGDSPTIAELETALNAGHTWERVDDNNPANTVDNDATREFKIDLAKLVDNEGAGAFTMAVGPTHVSEAKRLIEAERNKLAVLVETEQLEDQQKAIWLNVQEILLTRVFNANHNSTDDTRDMFEERLPDKVYRSAEDFESDKALGWIDDILWALDSANNLESALDEDENGLFVQYVDEERKEMPFVTNDAAADIYKQQEIQVRGSFGMTDFTRFGVWRARRWRNAVRSLAGHTGQNDSGNEWVNGELDTFAYSPLDATTITSTRAANYPVDGEATYEGSTVAYVGVFNATQGLVAFQGDVAVNVKWANPTGSPGDFTLGTMTAAISNFESAAAGDPLTHGGDNRFVRELLFTAQNGERIDIKTNKDHHVVFDGGAAQVTVTFADRTLTTPPVTAGITIDGAFVGNSSDGPLGVLGRYSIANQDPAFSFDNRHNNQRDVSIHGAFGADLP